jgi:hypothetical protein
MNVFSARETDSGYERTGQLIQPTGFENLLTVLKFIPLDEFSTVERFNHLISMTVINRHRFIVP